MPSLLRSKIPKKFLLTGGIALIVFVVINIVFAVSSRGRFDIPEWLGYSLYVTAFYVAPTAFVVAIIGSIVGAIKSELGKRAMLSLFKTQKKRQDLL